MKFVQQDQRPSQSEQRIQCIEPSSELGIAAIELFRCGSETRLQSLRDRHSRMQQGIEGGFTTPPVETEIDVYTIMP